MLRGTSMKPPRRPTTEARRPRHSASVRLGLVAFVASTMAGCNSGEPQRCIDANARVVPDSNCQTTTTSPYYGHHWYYGGRGLYVGDSVSGGSYTPHAGVSYHSSTSRGGFGHSSSIHGFGHS
jgi:hypothetical protein